MIIARLSPTESHGRRYLAGTIVTSEPLKVGTLVILKREGDEYELRTVEGFPACKDPAQGVLSFVIPKEEDT